MFKRPVYHSERIAPKKMRVLDPKRTVHRVMARMTNDRRLTKVLHKGLKCLIILNLVWKKTTEAYTHTHTHTHKHTYTNFMLFVSWH